MSAMEKPLSRKLADAVIARHTAPRAQWHYEHGLILKAIEEVWRLDKSQELLDFIQAYLDTFVGKDGSIMTYRLEEYNLDQVNPGKNLLFLHEVTGQERYRIAAATLRSQLATHPRTASGGFWHKKIYPQQMWLDGLYMQGPFYAQYARIYGPAANFDDIVQQFVLVEKHTRDQASGLLYHAWDESRQQLWANPDTGCSPHFWSRAMGWFGMALVDVLDWLPLEHKGRPDILAILGRYVEALGKYQDEASGMWYQVLDQGAREGNYLESSGSSMFVYTILKAVRMGYISGSGMESMAKRGFEGLKNLRLGTDDRGLPSLGGICSVAGLGGTPYRDGSFQYYVSEKIVADDYKGLGPFILACVEMERRNHG